MSTKANLDAVVEALNAALPAECRAYPLGEVPAKRPAEYVEVVVTRRFGGNPKASAVSDVAGYRTLLRAVSQASVDNVHKTLETCRGALEFQCLPVGDQATTPIQFETARSAGPDNGWFSGAEQYTHAL
ncbi:hypothetical protein F9L07_22630 [Pimelobacter simplex]|uniref:DUF3168 domain-containing protein n=1 Tax=Nocardioides simplex TaxID=2045 RepID=A0A7J5DT29_NOCSI|nr:hypothetical protein [Pimelobacter simplex]KAB2808314.1 hypothetical protein F9L07_22630 [Pimelobacter simplex]